MSEGHILHGPAAEVALPDFRKNISVIEILLEGMKKNGERVAMIEADTGKSITFSEFLKQSITIAANLSKYGLTEGDTVMLCSDKNILAYSILTAVIFTGATVALRESVHRKDELQHQLKNCKPKIVICSKESYDSIISLQKDSDKPTFFFIVITYDLENNSLLQNNSDFKVHQVKDIENHFPLILFTSGTTGLSKPVLIPNIALQRHGYSFCDEDCQKYLVSAPFSWISSTMIFVSSVIKNYTMVFSAPDPRLHLERTQYYKVDTWMIHPPMMLTLMSFPNLSDYDITSVKTIIVGGSTLNSHLKKTFKKKLFNNNIDLQFLYGMTEAGITTTFKDVNPEIKENTLTSGKVACGVHLKVVNENNETVGPRTQGEIRVKTDSMMAKYVDNPEATSRAFDSQGWYCSGDAGYYDENGLVYACGRLADLIHYKDNKMCATPLEGLLASHPAVFDAVVVAKPHPVDNEHPAAFVVLKPNVKITSEEIQKYVNDQVENKYKLRGGVYFVDTIPKLLNGKVLRHIFKKQFKNEENTRKTQR